MDNINDAIQVLQSIPDEAVSLYELTRDLDLLDTPIREGAWTPRQIFHHIADSHLNSYTRIKLAMTEDNPTIRPYNEKAWAELSDIVDVPISVSLQILDGIHKRIVPLLEKTLSQNPSVFEQTFFHPESGEVTIGKYTQNFANHGTSHLNAIRNLIDS